MHVYAVFYTPDFNEQLHSLHTTQEKALAAVDEAFGEKVWYRSLEELNAFRFAYHGVNIRPVEVQ